MTEKLAIQNARIREITNNLRLLENMAYELNYELLKSEYEKNLSGPSFMNGKEIKRIKKRVRTLFDGLTELIDRIESS